MWLHSPFSTHYFFHILLFSCKHIYAYGHTPSFNKLKQPHTPSFLQQQESLLAMLIHFEEGKCGRECVALWVCWKRECWVLVPCVCWKKEGQCNKGRVLLKTAVPMSQEKMAAFLPFGPAVEFALFSYPDFMSYGDLWKLNDQLVTG